MANGNMLSILREMAEQHKIDPEIGLPFIFQALIDLLGGQAEIVKENTDYRKHREKEIIAYRAKREEEEREFRAKYNIKIGACEQRLQALETRKDVRIALIAGGSTIVGALVAFFGLLIAG